VPKLFLRAITEGKCRIYYNKRLNLVVLKAINSLLKKMMIEYLV